MKAQRSIEIINFSIGTRFGAGCKFPGSGGAILGLLKDEETPSLIQKYKYLKNLCNNLKTLLDQESTRFCF